MKKRNVDNFKRSNEAIGERSERLEKKRNFDSLKKSNETAIDLKDLKKRENVTISEDQKKQLEHGSSDFQG